MSRKSPVGILITCLKVLAWMAMGIVLFVAGMLVMIVNTLSPDRLTPIVEKVASASIERGSIELASVELTLRPTFPFLQVRLDSVTVISEVRDRLPDSIRAVVPASADTLLRLDGFTGAVNLTALASGKIILRDVELCRPQLRMARFTDTEYNYDIFPPTDDTDTTRLVIPEFEFDRFRLTDPRPVEYRDCTDGTEAVLEIATVDIPGGSAPSYRLSLATNLHTPLLDELQLNPLTTSLDGTVVWSRRHPYVVKISDLNCDVAFLKLVVDTEMDFEDGFMVNSLYARVDSLPLDSLIARIPSVRLREYGIADLRTRAAMNIEGRLLKPYDVMSGMLPAANVSLELPDCAPSLGQFRLSKFSGKVELDLPDYNPDNAVVTIERLYAKGNRGGVDLSISGRLTHPVFNPEFFGEVKGHVRLGLLPQRLRDRLRAEIDGTLTLDTRMRVSPAHFTRNTFHRMYVDGKMELDKVYYASYDTVSMVYLHHGLIDFGTSKTFTFDTLTTPKLLSARVTVDSADILVGNISMNVKEFKAGVASVNEKGSSDTTKINPIGADVKIGGFNLTVLTDSTAVRLRDISCFATMKRFERRDKVPEFIFRLHAGRASVGSRTSRFMLVGMETDIRAHLDSSRASRYDEVAKIVDSVSTAHPHLPMDSIYILAMERYRAHHPPHGPRRLVRRDSLNEEIIDIELSKGFTRFLRRWDFTGTLTADRARLFTPVFPLRNVVRNLNLTFNPDSINLSDVTYKVGHSDFLINGIIDNVRRGLLSKGSSAIKIRFEMESDTVNVNQLASAIFAGAAYTARRDSLKIDLSHSDSDDDIENSIDSLHSKIDSVGPVLIPANVDAELIVKARNVHYSDLALRDLTGSVLLYKGALNLHDLRATGDVGSIGLSALYSAPRPDDISFGFGMQTEGFNIERFLKLVPAVDSVLPLMRGLGGIIDADIAATTRINPDMNIDMPSLKAAIKIQGDSLTLVDPETFKKVAKWLLFKNKNRNIIDSMSVEMLVEDSELKVFPFTFRFDRYLLGVSGYNDFAMNFNYHIAVLKSPLPFRFGVNLSGNPDKMKVRFGGSKFKKGQEFARINLVDTTRVNLLKQIQNVFRRGVENGRLQELKFTAPVHNDLSPDTLSAIDSLQMIEAGLLEAPEGTPVSPIQSTDHESESEEEDTRVSEQAVRRED